MTPQLSLLDWMPPEPLPPWLSPPWVACSVEGVAMLAGRGWRARWPCGGRAVVGRTRDGRCAWIAARAGEAEAQPVRNPEDGARAAERWLSV